MTRLALSSSFIFLLCLLLAGCSLYSSLTEPEKNRRSFDLITDDFTQRLRWQDYGAAAGHLDEPLRKDFLDRFRRDTDLKITDVRQENLVFNEEKTRAEGDLIIEYYRLPSPAVKTARLPLTWAFFGPKDPTPVGWKITHLQPDLP
ncbi:MAG: hypothetical protein Tsb0017_17430 [Geothermobacteraceae bacterium]